MKIAVFNAKPYDEQFLSEANQTYDFQMQFFETRLNEQTAQLAAGYQAVCVFVNDCVSRPVLAILSEQGVKMVALRCAGYNNVDLKAAGDLGLTVVRVPAYSPHAVAEHAVGMMLTLNRKFHKAYNRVREGNFTINGLLGFDMQDKIVGVVGTGEIGQIVARILHHGFGCQVVAFDPKPNPECVREGIQYVSQEALYRQADIITLHCPLTAKTHHLINREALLQMKPGVMIINTSRGGVIDTQALIEGLKSGRIGSLGLDVYEEEADIFFEDFSETGISDDILARLLTFQNVLVTSHQGFFTQEALTNIAHTTLDNIAQVAQGEICRNEISLVEA